jgi:hypothetical protein
MNRRVANGVGAAVVPKFHAPLVRELQDGVDVRSFLDRRHAVSEHNAGVICAMNSASHATGRPRPIEGGELAKIGGEWKYWCCEDCDEKLLARANPWRRRDDEALHLSWKEFRGEARMRRWQREKREADLAGLMKADHAAQSRWGSQVTMTSNPFPEAWADGDPNNDPVAKFYYERAAQWAEDEDNPFDELVAPPAAVGEVEAPSNPFDHLEQVVQVSVAERESSVAKAAEVRDEHTAAVEQRLVAARLELAEIDKLRGRRSELTKLIAASQNILAERKKLLGRAKASATQLTEIEELTQKIAVLRSKGANCGFPMLSPDELQKIPERDQHLLLMRRFAKMLAQSLEVKDARERKFKKEAAKAEKLVQLQRENDKLRAQLLKPANMQDFSEWPMLPGPASGLITPSEQTLTGNDQ